MDQETAETAHSTEAFSQNNRHPGEERRPTPRRTIGRLGVGAQLGGFYDLGDPALELRAWARRVGGSFSWGRHLAEPHETGYTQVSSQAGKQVTGAFLFAFNNPQPGRRLPIKVYGTAGIVHATQARGKWQRITPGRDGTVGLAGVEGSTGYRSFVGAGAEFGFTGLPGLAVGSEILLAVGGEGVAPGLRFGVRYYMW
jgi:hypothetical protein